MGWAKLFAGLVSLFNTLFKTHRENEFRKDGAREADLAQRKKLDKVKAQAKKIRRSSSSRSKPDILKRL